MKRENPGEVDSQINLTIIRRMKKFILLLSLSAFVLFITWSAKSPSDGFNLVIEAILKKKLLYRNNHLKYKVV